MVDESHKNPRTKKDETDKILSMEDKEQLESETLDESKVVDEAEDLDSSEFTSGIDNPSDGNAEANPEIDKSTRSKRFSKEHAIDEEELRKNKFKPAKAGSDSA